VVVDFGGSARAVTSAGLPVLDESNTVVTITDGASVELAKGAAGISVRLAVGVKITVKAEVKTAAGYWTGEKTHTVQAGLNSVGLTLSKTPERTENILFFARDDGEGADVRLGSKTLAAKVESKVPPKISRDGIGRVYLLYADLSVTPSVRRLRRFNVDGDFDKDFTLPPPDSFHGISQMSVDAKTGNIFLIDSTGASPQVLCMTEDGTVYKANLAPLVPGMSRLGALAAFDGTLFLEAAVTSGSHTDEKLFAFKTELQESGSVKTLNLTAAGVETLEKIAVTGISGIETNCADMYADGAGVYVLLNADNTRHEVGSVYSAGKIVGYTYTGSGFTDKTEAGLNPAHAENGGLAFDASYFSKPVAFVGYDKDALYIADDGANIVYKNENFRADGNKNRIAAFDRQTKTLAFTDTEAKWFAEYGAYKLPNTPALSWEPGDFTATFGMKYWTSADGKAAFSEANKLWVSTDYQIKPSDIFCFDQDGNFYIHYMDGNYSDVRRFTLKEDGSYDTTSESARLESDGLVTAIAADVSDGKSCLYVVHQQSAASNWKIRKYEWNGSSFLGLAAAPAYTITGDSSTPGIVTALAANKDGLFAAVKKEDNVIMKEYSLSVRKYKKDNASSAGEVSVVDKMSMEESHASNTPYKTFAGAINALQIQNGALYCTVSTEEALKKSVGVLPAQKIDAFKTSGALYKVSETSAFGGTAQKLLDKPFSDSAKTGYGFYRFSAFRQGAFVIASDGAWGVNGVEASGHTPSPEIRNTKKVVACDSSGGTVSESDSGGKFSKKLQHDSSGGLKWN
ncbi:MAG: hypothetical protein ACTTKL_02215, partial [Treponema sp.]